MVQFDRGGIIINDHCQTSDPDIYAIGECALDQNRIYGLVAPGYKMASVVADVFSNTIPSTFAGADMSTLKLLGVDVASFGDNFAKTPGAKEIAVTDAVKGVYQKLVLNEDGSQLLGGILVGDASAYGTLLQFVQNAIALPPHVEQLPQFWQRLVDARFESGHAYAKALRTVKYCVGSTWCRFGVQDSTSLAIQVEERYRGLRSPHKLKSAVSGCTRECAEAQSKDFGIIATEKGWNLYVCGNGGMKPQHAILLAEDVDTETLIKYLDRVPNVLYSLFRSA